MLVLISLSFRKHQSNSFRMWTRHPTQRDVVIHDNSIQTSVSVGLIFLVSMLKHEGISESSPCSQSYVRIYLYMKRTSLQEFKGISEHPIHKYVGKTEQPNDINLISSQLSFVSK